ncbi:putative diphthamide synthesis protein-domain-containing protein [Lipomyces tetrasporus]|uniref:2-(3-amino-3-carboxypropyl)histidine synthase subunit 1 n=1 Tax=Lipomyces tetrasporus TaxID=54092 RepID=A0AAD7VUN8_9ASCO|nr:putative diphthamide synthesis protein-domain-containing protein [Lipomyces tetrasporus]KAJ8102039.1 putative diphthamide synthesis protein-domain-containing protein [Lipomyces tetrasporus]
MASVELRRQIVDSRPSDEPPVQRRFAGRKARVNQDGSKAFITTRIPRKSKVPLFNQIPPEILDDPDLASAISSLLPANYDFEIHKCIWNIRRHKYKRVALQMPEGLLIFACVISDIIERFAGHEVSCVIMGDVTYGACCIDDFTAKALGCDLLIHYAHSCLVPVDLTQMRILYVFVSIAINEQHLIATLKENFDRGTRLTLVGTIQFNGALHAARNAAMSAADDIGLDIQIPQISPLSRGEILGCTAPKIDPSATDAIVYVGDGRFHLEAAMIQNPGIAAYRYDPYSRKFTNEEYEHGEMLHVRYDAIEAAKSARRVGLILGALGRQGNYATFDKIRGYLVNRGIDYTLLLLSEIFPQKLAEFEHLDAFVQVACPRLSIDWGYAFAKPLLTPYEACIAFGDAEMWSALDAVVGGQGEGYRMDYYAKDGLGRTFS